MKRYGLLPVLLICWLALVLPAVKAQVYRASETDALQNNGLGWASRKLPPSVVTYNDNSGLLEIKASLSSLFLRSPDSTALLNQGMDSLADFTMTLNKDQVTEQQAMAGRIFNTTGILKINHISRKTVARCQLGPGTEPGDGFSISVMIRFNPADFGMKMMGETEKDPLMVRINDAYLNKRQLNY